MTHTTPEVEVQTDYSEGNMLAIELLTRCLSNGYKLRIDDLEVTEYPELKIVSLRPSTCVTAKHEADIQKAVEEEKERIKQEVKDMALAIKNDAHFMTELEVCDWLINEVLTPTKTDEQTEV